MTKQRRSAGVLLYRRREGALEVFLVHPGGPYWANKDAGAWSIPKGEPAPGEGDEAAACREFAEETGFALEGALRPLGESVSSRGKVVIAFALHGDCDPARLRSNTCRIEWPPRSGRELEIPEVDRGAWFSLAEAAERISAGQRVFLDRLLPLAAG
jgi:predicted NUDIX family NTP pyrophosphohydrolase